MSAAPGMFHLSARVLHWLMAVMIVVMLFIGAGMVASVSARHGWLLALHKPLGIAILALACLRLLVRLRHRPPALSGTLTHLQRMAATGSHWLLYGLMFALPLVGWMMLSASGAPVVLGAGLHLPAITPVDTTWFAVLRWLHRALAYLLFGVFLVHMGAALHHGLIRRDGVLRSMLWRKAVRIPRPEPAAGEPEAFVAHRATDEPADHPPG